MVKRLTPVSSPKPPEQSPEQTGSEKVLEQVPTWLRMLLTKYGEREVPLVGLETGHVEEERLGPPLPTAEEESHLSDVLERMAEEGLEPVSDRNVPTSVEWGAAAEEPPAAPIDDVLAGIGTTQEDDDYDTSPAYDQPFFEPEAPDTGGWSEQDYDQPVQMPTQVGPSAPASGDDEVPDWLTQALEAPPPGPPTPSFSPPESQPPSSVSREEVPDWLTEALEEPAPAPAPAESQQPFLASPTDQEIPDRLTEPPPELGELASETFEPAETTFEAEVDQPEVPGWLTEIGVPTAGVLGTSPESAAFESDTLAPEVSDWEVPDWITEGIEDISAQEKAQEKPKTEATLTDQDIPDWIAWEQPLSAEEELSAPEVETPQIPDWLMAVDETPAPTVSSPPPAPVETVEPSPAAEEIPDWLTPDSNASIQADMLGEIEADVTEAEQPGWLLDATPSKEEIPAVTVEQPFEPQLPSGPPPDDGRDIPTWLQNVQTESPPLKTPHASIPKWLENIQVSSERPAIVSEQPPDWLKSVQVYPDEAPSPAPVAEEGKAPGVSETTATSPDDWLTDLEVPPTEDTAAPTAEMVSTADTDDWVVDLEAPPTEDMPAVAATAEAIPATDDWLTDFEIPSVGEIPVATPAVETPPVSDTSDWLADLEMLPADDTVATPTTKTTPAADTDDWLADLGVPSVDDGFAAEAEPEIPPWLSELPEAEGKQPAAAPIEPAIEEEIEFPAWWSEEAAPAEAPSAAPTETRAEVEAEIPPWLLELPEEEGGQPTEARIEPAEAEFEMPAWLSEVEETPADAPASAFVEPAAEAEEETPAWPSELPEAEGETLPWLSELPEVESEQPAAASIEPAVEEEIEFPAWWSEETGPITGPPSTPAEPRTEVEDEIPAWLSELPEVESEQPAAAPIEPVAEEEVEFSAWWSEEAAPAETPSAAPAGPRAEMEAEIPSWLSELPEEEGEQPTVAPAEAPPTAHAQPTAEVGPEIPAWLSELPEAPTTGPLSPLSEGAESPEAEVPPWLSDMPRAPDTGLLSRLREFEEADGESEKSAWPSEPPGVETGQPPVVPGEPTADVEVEFPAWWSEEEAPITEPSSTPTEPSAEAEDETPPWLSELPEVETEQPPTATAELSEADVEIPGWLPEEAAPAEAPPAAPAEPTVEVEPEMPAWLSELPEAPDTGLLPPLPERSEPTGTKAPAWLSDMPRAPGTGLLSRLKEFEDAEAETEAPSWSSELPEAETEQPPSMPAEPSADAEEEPPFWFSELPEVETEEPPSTSSESVAEVEPGTPWLPDAEITLTEEEAPSEPTEKTVEEEPEWPSWLFDSAETPDDKTPDQDWLSGLGEATEAVEAALPPEESDKLEPLPPPPKTDETKPDPDLGGIKASQASAPSQAPAPSSVAKSSSWLQALEPTEATITVEDSQATESTGVLAGLTGLLPAEKLVTAIPAIEPRPTNGQAEAILAAAQGFYTIATQTPQPATLPTPLTQQRQQLMGGVARALVYVLFIILVALPLLPGIQSETGRQVPWTEPSGELNEVLGKQRRLLVSEELGVIDLQQPGSVALVSFDFTTATQGEMQPLAEAIVGRLRGQGMRLIFVSLEPEGAALAQEMLNQERDEAYGVNMVNLGYLPGQIVGIRELATGRKPLSTIKDFKDGLTFESAERAEWNDVNNLSQIDVVVTLADNPTIARWWIEQMEMAANNPDGGERLLLAATSAAAAPFLQPYRDSRQLDGLIAGINGAAAIEAGRKQFGPARQMLDSQSIAHLFIVILIAAGTIAGWMPPLPPDDKQKNQPETLKTKERR
jgi:hypothetical protein